MRFARNLGIRHLVSRRSQSGAAAGWEGADHAACVQVDTSTGEIAGVFESIQPSDTDLGAKAPKDVKITGLWYGQLS